jgi:glycosyltransferase involved in cell wall biosynthesis
MVVVRGKTNMKSESAPTLCFIINCDYRSIGGSRTRFRKELEYFSTKNYRLTVIYSSGTAEKSFTKKNVNYYNIRHFRYLPVLYQLRLFFKCLKLYSSDSRITFVAHEPISLIPPSFLRVAGLHPRTVLVMHGPSAVETYLRGNKTIATFLSMIDRIAFRLAGRIIAISEYERDYAVSLKANPGKITIIRNGIELPRLTKDSSFRQEMGIPSDKVLIGYLGTVAAYRGTEFLIKAFPIAKTLTKASLALVLVFREELNAEQRRRIAEIAGYDEDVFISRPREDISPVLPALDIYASHFSKRVDGIGFSIMEAMGGALPVITGTDAITAKLLRDGYNAILVSKENSREIAMAIKKLAENPLIRKTIGANAKKTAQFEFSKEHMVTVVEKEYVRDQ